MPRTWAIYGATRKDDVGLSSDGQKNDIRGAASPAARISPVPTATASCLLTPEQLADRWQISRAAVYRLTREGKVPVVRLGKRYRYRLAAIEEFEGSGGCLA